MALNPTPQRKQILQFPTPNLDDRVFYELHDATQMNYSVPEYGTPHPNQGKYTGFVFAHVKSANDSGWAMWFYLNERANQDDYNYEVTYPYADTSYPAYVRTYVLKREGLVEPAAGTSDPVLGTGYVLTGHKQTRLADPVLDSLFVGVQRAYEKLPGPVITSYVINSRGDLETQNEQAVPAGESVYPDGLNTIKSGIDYESTVKGKKVYSTVPNHSVLSGKLIVDAMEGVPGAVTSSIVPTNTALPALGASVAGGYVLSASLSPASATKSELKVVTVGTLPTTKKVYYNDRGELETETTTYVTSAVGSPNGDSLTTVKSAFIQDSVGFGRRITATVPSYQSLTTVSYSSEYKGAKVTETVSIEAPTAAVAKPGTTGVGGKIVSSSLSQKSKTKAVKKITAIESWPTLYDYFFEDELNSWVSVKYEIIPAAQATAEVTAAAIPFVEVEYKGIDAYWTAKTTKTVLTKVTKNGTQGAFRIDRQEVQYEFPSIFYGITYKVAVNTRGKDYTSVQPLVLSGIRKYVPAKVHVIYCNETTPLSRDNEGKPFTVTQLIPVSVRFDGILMRFDAGRCLCNGGNGEYAQAFSGTNSQRWQPPILEQYYFPRSYPAEMPDTVQLPVRITPWKYNLFKHEMWVLETKLPVVNIDTTTGAIFVQEP